MIKRPIPCCKPFRIVELVTLIIIFVLLFFLRKYNTNYDNVVDTNLLLFLFTVFGTFLILTAVDVLCQAIRQPISNIPMMEVLILGAAFCFVAGIFALVVRMTHAHCNAFTTLNALSLIVCLSFFVTVTFVLDAIILTKFAYSRFSFSRN